MVISTDDAASDDAVFERLGQLRHSLIARLWRALFLISVLLVPLLLMLMLGTALTGLGWLAFLLTAAVVSTVIVYAIGGYQKTVGELLAKVQLQRDEVRDMSQRLAEALQAQERANAAKSVFLAHMTHELRTPLSGVIGILDIAEQRNPDPAIARLLEVARTSAHAQLRIINDVLDFSRLDAGKVSLAPEYFDLHAFIHSLLEVFHWRAREKGLTFRCHLDARLAPVRHADQGRVRQVLFNLLSNAMKFTLQGSVTLTVGRPDGAEPDDSRVLFELRDTGIGIAPQALHKLFAQFEQLDSAVHQRFGGTGLGLAISKALIEAMHGTIAVQSAAGAGSVFTVVLPMAIGRPADLIVPINAPAAPGQAHGVQLNVLLADDSPTNQLVVSMLLQDMGHRVVVSDNGLMALELAARENFDLILMDLRMPVLAGCEAAAMLRQGGTPQATVFDRDVFICAVTANTTPQERANALSVGMNEFLAKPVRQDELHALIARVIVFQRQRGVALNQALALAGELPGELPGITDWAVLPTSTPAIRIPEPAGPSRRDRLQAVFRMDLQDHLAALMHGTESQQWQKVREAAHVIRGAALAVGVPLLAGLGAELESACVAGDQALMQRLAVVLIGDVKTYLEAAG